MKDFFVSYNKADKTWAEWIAWTLEAAGYSVVIQVWDFRPGGNFVLDMQQAASGTDKTIALLSEDYLKAKFTQPEWAAAFAKDPEGQERNLVPVRVAECKPEGLLGPIVYVDLVGLPEADAKMALLGAFSGRAKPSKAPAFPAVAGTKPGVSAVIAKHYPGIASSASVAKSLMEKPAEPTKASEKLSPKERLDLMQRLGALSPTRFNMLVEAVDAPPGEIPPMYAPQGDRAVVLFRVVVSPGGCGVGVLIDILEKLEQSAPGSSAPVAPDVTDANSQIDGHTIPLRGNAHLMRATILFLAASPTDVTKLALDEECRAIRTKIRASDYRDALEFKTEWAVRPDDLLQYLNEHRPHVVHFSGHGSANEELILHNDAGVAKPVSKAALQALFRTLKDNIRLVVLNACYSKPQAEGIVEVIDCAVGMSKTIGDEAAIVFAGSFYRALGFGLSVQDAFEQGRTALLLEGIPEDRTPELLVKQGVDAADVYLVGTEGPPQ